MWGAMTLSATTRPMRRCSRPEHPALGSSTQPIQDHVSAHHQAMDFLPHEPPGLKLGQDLFFDQTAGQRLRVADIHRDQPCRSPPPTGADSKFRTPNQEQQVRRCTLNWIRQTACLHAGRSQRCFQRRDWSLEGQGDVPADLLTRGRASQEGLLMPGPREILV